MYMRTMSNRINRLAHFYETNWVGGREGVAGRELVFLGGDGNPGFDRTNLFDSVAFFAAVVFAVGEGVILGRMPLGNSK